MITKVPTELIEANNQESGTVQSDGSSLVIIPADKNIATKLDVNYDSVSGTLTLHIPDYPVLTVEGFMTQADIKEGRVGRDGRDGYAGINGLDGEEGQEGARGCIGPQGPRGKRGQRGLRGQRGPIGETGPTGFQGATGKSGALQVFVQADDPGDVAPGAVWVKL